MFAQTVVPSMTCLIPPDSMSWGEGLQSIFVPIRSILLYLWGKAIWGVLSHIQIHLGWALIFQGVFSPTWRFFKWRLNISGVSWFKSCWDSVKVWSFLLWCLQKARGLKLWHSTQHKLHFPRFCPCCEKLFHRCFLPSLGRIYIHWIYIRDIYPKAGYMVWIYIQFSNRIFGYILKWIWILDIFTVYNIHLSSWI